VLEPETDQLQSELIRTDVGRERGKDSFAKLAEGQLGRVEDHV
jgi:hypothetical protein